MIRQENFASLVDEMRRVFEGTTSQTNIGFELVMGENLPTYFNTDKDRLLQCIGNLVSNAIRFSPEKAKVILAIQFTNGILEFSVLDQGRGISEESLPHIFEPYWKQNSPGAGLGLYIVKGIVDSLHGSMHVRRVATGGVCVSVRLPNMSETMWHKYLEAA